MVIATIHIKKVGDPITHLLFEDVEFATLPRIDEHIDVLDPEGGPTETYLVRSVSHALVRRTGKLLLPTYGDTTLTVSRV